MLPFSSSPNRAHNSEDDEWNNWPGDEAKQVDTPCNHIDKIAFILAFYKPESTLILNKLDDKDTKDSPDKEITGGLATLVFLVRIWGE